MFLKADADYSGLLSLEELHLGIRDMGADVTQDQLADMLSDFEIERDGQIDMDTFIAIFGSMEFRGTGTKKETYMKI